MRVVDTERSEKVLRSIIEHLNIDLLLADSQIIEHDVSRSQWC
jgi:hypothetical protein